MNDSNGNSFLYIGPNRFFRLWPGEYYCGPFAVGEKWICFSIISDIDAAAWKVQPLDKLELPSLNEASELEGLCKVLANHTCGKTIVPKILGLAALTAWPCYLICTSIP